MSDTPEPVTQETTRKDPIRRTVYADSATWMAIKLMAQKLDRSENWIVRRAMQDFITKNSKEEQR